MRLRRLLRWMAFAIAAVCAIGLLVLALAQTRWGQERIRRVIEARATAALNGDVRLGSVEWSPRGRIELRDLVITQGSQPFLASSSVSVRYHTWQVIRHGLVFDEVVLERPAINLVERADGWNVLKLVRARTQADSTGPAIRIGRVLIHDGVLGIHPLRAPARELDSLNVDTNVSYVNRQLRADVASGSARDAQTGVVLSRIRIATSITGGDLTFSDIDLVAGSSHITGKIRWATSVEETDVDVTLEASPLALSEIGHYVPRFRNIPLAPSLEVRAQGTTREMSVELEMASEAGRVSGHAKGRFQNGIGQFAGRADVASLDLAPWLERPDLQSRITGQSSFDLTLPDAGPALSLAFDSKLAEIAVAGYAASDVRAKGTYDAERLNVAGSGTAYGSAFTTTATWTRASAELSARGRFANLDLRRLPRELAVPAMESVLAGDYDTTVGRGSWRGNVVLTQSVVEGAQIAAGATGHVAARVAGIEYSFQGTVTGIDPDRFKPFITPLPEAVERVHGRFNAAIDLDARGTRLADASTNLELTLTDSRLCPSASPCGAEPGATGTLVERLDAKVSLEARRLLTDVKGDLKALSAPALGFDHPSAPTADGHIEAHIVVADVLAPMSATNLEGTARATFTNASVFGLAIENAVVDAAVIGGIARVNALDVLGSAAKVSAKGTVALIGKGQSNLSYLIDVADLSMFQTLTRHTLSGSAHAEGRITGPSGQLKTAGTLASNSLTAGPAKALAVKSHFDLAIPVNDLERTIGQMDLSGLFVEVSGRRIDEVTGTLRYDGGRLDVDAILAERARTLRVAGALVPHPDHHEVHVRSLSVLAGDVEWQMPQGQEAVAQYAADRLVISNFELTRADSRIRINGTASAKGGAESPLVVTVERVRVDDVNRILLGTRKLSGFVDGTARISGALSNPRVEVDLSVTAGQIEGVAFDSFGGHVNLEGPRLTLDVRLDAGAAGRMTAVGTVPIAARARAGADAPPFDLRVQSPFINLALFQPMTTHLDMMTGTGQFDLQISGEASKPSIDGLVGVQSGSFRVVPTGVIYSGVEAAMAAEGDRLTVQQMRVLDDDGHPATVTGSLKVAALGRPSDFNLVVQGRDFHVVHNRFGELSVSSDLRVMGDFASPLVTGTLRIDRGRLEVGDLLERFGASGYKPADPEAAEQVEEAVRTAVPAAGASYSVTVDFPDNLVLRGRDLRGDRGAIGLGDVNVTLGGALTVAKDTTGPMTLLGQLVVIRGQYTFQGRPFTIQRDSELRFGGDEILNPSVDVRAERHISGVVAQVHLAGTLREPTVALSSQPPLDEGDILSLIAFNQTMNQLQTSERVSLASRAGVLAARAFAAPIADSVARALDFDLFEIQPGEDVSGAGATIVVGRQVSDRLFVGFRHQFGAEDLSQVSFEYRLNEFLRVVTSFAEGAELSGRVPREDRAALDFIFVIRR